MMVNLPGVCDRVQEELIFKKEFPSCDVLQNLSDSVRTFPVQASGEQVCFLGSTRRISIEKWIHDDQDVLHSNMYR